MDLNLMGVAQKFKISKSQLLSSWFLEDILDVIEYGEVQAALEEEHKKNLEQERKSK